MGPIAGAELAEQAPGVGLDRVLRTEQLAADLGVATPLGHSAEHLKLTFGQHDARCLAQTDGYRTYGGGEPGAVRSWWGLCLAAVLLPDLGTLQRHRLR